MAGAASVLEDDSLLSRLDRGLAKAEWSMALVSGLGAFALMVLAVVSVSGRNLFNEPLRGYVDWIEAAMPLIAIFGISYVQRLGGHIRMDIVVGALKGRALWAAEFITTLGVLVLMVLLVWGTWAHFDRSFDCTRPLCSRDSSIDINLPLWPAKLVVPVAFSVMCVRLVLQLWGYGRALVLGLTEPVGVPLVQSAAEVAAAEAEQVRGHD
ncbi:TRAP transporter small permease subunit [Citreimonas salinaria]|uniref:TRAP transporter small permease protein n=1 Tax=Citreimonas salinaria TaxID=321339 RepID=A0A1H3IV15_9RHOB|nr:TRAP transporter small permease [Citreimonas salinaria]SDY31560.1 TRAP-type C4-dicarboxylate transport system, small permease component [Citreimonas salinaria]